MSECIFCKFAKDLDSAVYHDKRFFWRRDAYPVSPGHTLIIPRQHYETFFDLPYELRVDLERQIREVKLELDEEFKPNGYNVGFNCGEAAGQTVMHCHIHVIPRYVGDIEDPRGGVRGCIPSMRIYESGVYKYEPENGHF